MGTPVCAQEGFGRALRPLMPARQAGTGGVAIENWQEEGTVIEAGSILLEPGLRWFGGELRSGIGESVRFGGEIFCLSAPDITITAEKSNGSYRGEQGSIDYSELGGRLDMQFKLVSLGAWQAGCLGRASTLTQKLPSGNQNGIAFEPGVMALNDLGDGRSLVAWGLSGPFGKSSESSFSGQYTLGASYGVGDYRGVLGGPEAYSVGAEGQLLSEGLWQGGLGGVYRFGKTDGGGMALLMRLGMRYADGSAQVWQPRGGVGVMWGNEEGIGLRLDYSVVPIGELGYYHYISLGMMIPHLMEPEPEETSGIIPSVEAHAPKAKIKSERVLYFYPLKGEKAVVKVRVRQAAELRANLVDDEGKLILVLEEGRKVAPGIQTVEWDGTVAHGVLATFELTYFIRVYCGKETKDFRVIPMTVQ